MQWWDYNIVDDYKFHIHGKPADWTLPYAGITLESPNRRKLPLVNNCKLGHHQFKQFFSTSSERPTQLNSENV